jgi:CRP/FNR family transcriptional regulator
MTDLDIKQTFGHLGLPLVEEISAYGTIQEIPEGTEILREGQYIKVIPLVLKGAIKVFTRFKDKELLLYYILPEESCIMSFSANLRNEPSKVFAITETDTTALLLPADKIAGWIRKYPNFNTLFYQMYNERYADMLDTINHLLFSKLDQRVLDHLAHKKNIAGSPLVKITHKQIANELGTAREVISRVMKKLEKEDQLRQHQDGIEIL